MIDRTTVRYGIAGVVNTLVGYFVFLVCHYALEMPVLIANASCYAAGLSTAYMLNVVFVFNSAEPVARSVFIFVIVFWLAFGLNQLVVYILYYWILMEAALAQIMGMALYTVTFYLLNRYVVFRHSSEIG